MVEQILDLLSSLVNKSLLSAVTFQRREARYSLLETIRQYGQERLKEAAKHGFKRAIVPKANLPRNEIKGMEVIGVSKISEALDAL